MTRKARIEFNGHRVTSTVARTRADGFRVRPEGSTRSKGKHLSGLRFAANWRPNLTPAHTWTNCAAPAHSRDYAVDPKQLAKGPTVAELAERWLEASRR